MFWMSHYITAGLIAPTFAAPQRSWYRSGMDGKYVLGVFVAILSGIFITVGAMLQKYVVSQTPLEIRKQGLMRHVIRRPRWLLGLVMQLVLGAACYMLAMDLIGPALVPGLMAGGLIVLAIGSVKLMGEKLSRPEYLGLALMTIGILLLGLSGMTIRLELVRESLFHASTLMRIAVFTGGLLLLSGMAHLVSLRSTRRKGVILGFSNGILYALSNFWVSPLMAVIMLALTGRGTSAQLTIFVVACFVLVGTNLTAIVQIQQAFRHGQVSNIIPVQQIPIQIAPILVYFYAFALRPPKNLSSAFIIISVLLIISSGFLLGRRQSELEKIR